MNLSHLNQAGALSEAPEAGQEILFQSELTRVLRIRRADGSAIVCKEFLGANAEQRLRHEKSIMERLAAVPGVPRLVAGSFPRSVIAMEDAGVPLADLLRVGLPELARVLQLGLELAQILAALHEQGVAHKNLTPENLLLSGRFKPTLIDFSLATTFAEERPGFVHPRDIAGTLPYLAPEQTGRTGRAVDQRADLYALGVTLYQMATGRLPFENQEPLQLIHDILALVPVAPLQLNPALPQALNDIIISLLQKEPDRRYQSAQGVAHDLARLGEALASGEEASFPLGERDFPLRLSSPSRLVGRQKEIAALHEAFQRALGGAGCCVLVAGEAGVGKSALLNELRPIVTARRGFFAAGKFDQYRRDLASDAVYQALRALGRLLLSEPESELQEMRRKMLHALGSNAGLVAALQPEFGLLLGSAPELYHGEPLNAKERLIQATLDLLRAIVSPKRPLVLLIDDLQWAPPTPLGFFKSLATDQAIPGLLLVASFREGELKADGELRGMLSRWEHLAQGPPLLRLGNLAPDELALFLQEMLRLEPEQALKLARAVALRSGGNPYDTVELINALRCDGTLSAGEHGWSWDESAIRRYVGQGDVVELLEERIKRLPAKAQALLETLACLGGEVAPELIALAGGLSADQLEQGLTPSLEDGLLLPQDGGRGVRFRHDRVQQAAYARVQPAQKLLLHLSLARRLAAQPGFETQAAEQYLPALEALEDPLEKRLVISLLQSAAAGAGTVNLEEAERFLAAALALLASVESPADLPLLIALETEQHAALYSIGRFAAADQIYASIERRAQHALDLAQAASLQVCSLTSRARPEEAVALGLEQLKKLGIVVPGPEQIDAATRCRLEQLKGWIDSRDRLKERQRPESADLSSKAAASLINRIIPPAFFCDQAAISWWLVLESLRLWIEHGPCAALIGPMSHLGFVSITLNGDYRSGNQAVRHLLEVGEARGWEPETSQARFIYALSVAPWFEPLQQSVLQARRAHEGLLQGGDLQNACFTYYASSGQFLDCAPTLAEFAAEIDGAFTFAARTGNAQVEASLRFFREMIRQLRGETGAADSSSDARQKSDGSANDGGNANVSDSTNGGDNATAASVFHSNAGLCAAISGNKVDLARHAAALKPWLPQIQAMYVSAQANVLLCLALAQQVRDAATGERSALLAQFDEAREFLAGRAADAPENFLHLLRWLDAERAGALGEFRDAVTCFDAALEQANALQRPWHRALITERAALFHLECGLGQLGRMLMAQARQLYDEWGASAKVRQLDQKYPFLRAARAAEREAEPGPGVSADAIDMLAILRASQALSSETSLERLRTLVVDLLGTMTGATAVSLLVRRDQANKWYLLPAENSGTSQLVPVDEAAGRGLIPISVFHYAERTGKPLMVEDAMRDDRFYHDSYLADYACCSLLAVPILNHGTCRAVLLLENRLCRGAFTADLLDAVTLIAGQLAVSLENALLYEKLEERVRERTRELQEAQSELMAAARLAGMAEIASNVLHNVGNVLNSVNISAGLVMDRLQASRIAGLSQSVQLMNQHAGDLGHFLSQDQKGRLLPVYLEKLAQTLAAEQREILAELTRLTRSVDHIKEIVATQRCYAGSARLIEPVQIVELAEEALRINQQALLRHQVTLVKEFAVIPVLPLDKARLLQILVNLIRNAKQAMSGIAPESRRITLRLELTAACRLRISVRDQGVGIEQENLWRIFSHGYTTKKDGHGFGLHSCALAAKEMGGTLSASSPGAGQGACFVLEIPVLREEPRHGTR